MVRPAWSGPVSSGLKTKLPCASPSAATTRDLPVVVLTTRAGAKHVDLARELGVEHYVAKPVDEASFVQLVESLAAPIRAGV